MTTYPHFTAKTLSALCTGILLALSIASVVDAAPAYTVPAESPAPIPTAEDSIITYNGPETWTYDDGEVQNYEQKFGADCSTGKCFLFIERNENMPPNTEIIDGRASFEIAASGTLCSDDYEYPGVTSAVFDGGAATLTQTKYSSGIIDCPDGTRTQYIGYTSVTNGSLVTGNPCFLDNSCPTPEPTPTVIAEPIVIPVAPVSQSRGFDEPSILSTLAPVGTAVTIRNTLWASAMAVVLALLVAFPKQLLSSAASTGSKRLAKWSEKFTKTTGASMQRLRRVVARTASIKGWTAVIIGVAIAAIISSFVDPEFGWNTASIRTFISILVSLALQILTGWMLLIWLVRRAHPSAKPEFEFRPFTLIIVTVAVVLTRLTGFQPGIIFGLVAGLSFGAILSKSESAKVALIGMARAFVLSLIAWIGYSLMSSIIDGGPIVVFVTETLSGITIAGIVALPLALIPFKGSTGQTIWDWNRWIWAASYAVGLAGFFLVLMPMPFAWKEVPVSLSVWIGMYVLYTAASVALWTIIVQPWRKDAATGAKASDNPATGAKEEMFVVEDEG